MIADVGYASAAQEAWALISDLFWEMRPRMAALAAEFGLTPPQMFALKALDPQRPMPMGELAAQLHCDSSNVTGLIDRLTAQGLVERQEAPGDRRVRMLAVTDDGVRVRERMRSVMIETPAMLARLDPDDQLALRDLLRRARTRPDKPDGGSAVLPG
jgi:DNA-binding MarR family transcriptional regulator